jgi:hypothetical protein
MKENIAGTPSCLLRLTHRMVPLTSLPNKRKKKQSFVTIQQLASFAKVPSSDPGIAKDTSSSKARVSHLPLYLHSFGD